jgi:hypothetical protein
MQHSAQRSGDQAAVSPLGLCLSRLSILPVILRVGKWHSRWLYRPDALYGHGHECFGLNGWNAIREMVGVATASSSFSCCFAVPWIVGLTVATDLALGVGSSVPPMAIVVFGRLRSAFVGLAVEGGFSVATGGSGFARFGTGSLFEASETGRFSKKLKKFVCFPIVSADACWEGAQLRPETC